MGGWQDGSTSITYGGGILIPKFCTVGSMTGPPRVWRDALIHPTAPTIGASVSHHMYGGAEVSVYLFTNGSIRSMHGRADACIDRQRHLWQ